MCLFSFLVSSVPLCLVCENLVKMDNYEDENTDFGEEEDLTDQINEEEEEEMRRMENFRRSQIQLHQMTQHQIPTPIQQNHPILAASARAEIGPLQGLQALQNLAHPIEEQPFSPGVTVEASQYQRFVQLQPNLPISTQPTNAANDICDELLIDTVKAYPILWGAAPTQLSSNSNLFGVILNILKKYSWSKRAASFTRQ